MAKMFRLVLTIIGFFLVAAPYSTAFGLILPPNAVGKVSVHTDPVMVIHEGKSKTVGSFGLVLMKGDLIKTGKTGKATVVLAAGDAIFIAPDSSLSVTREPVRKVKKKQFGGFLLSAIGKIRAKIKKIKKRRIEIRTANAVIGVKGTEFIVEYVNNQTTVGTLEGLVNMESITTKKSIDIPPGKMTSVSPLGEVMSLKDIAGELMKGVEFAGEKMKQEEFSGERVKM